MSIFRKYKNLEEILPGFLLEKEIGVKYKTFSSYRSHAQVLIDWLDTIGKKHSIMREISQNNIHDFFMYLAVDKKLDLPTCKRYFTHLRIIFNYAYDLGEIDEVPFDRVVFPRKKRNMGAELIHPLDLKPLLEKIKEKDPQLYLACMMEYYCFIRPGRELRLLKVGDVDCKAGIIIIREENAKNKLKQPITMPQQLIDLCKEYGVDKADRNLFIFGVKKKFNTTPVSLNMLRYRFNIIRDELGLSKGYKLYSFKHIGASNLHKSGVSMMELMIQLRHTQLENTSHYLKNHCGIINDRIRDNFPNPL